MIYSTIDLPLIYLPLVRPSGYRVTTRLHAMTRKEAQCMLKFPRMYLEGLMRLRTTQQTTVSSDKSITEPLKRCACFAPGKQAEDARTIPMPRVSSLKR